MQAVSEHAMERGLEMFVTNQMNFHIPKLRLKLTPVYERISITDVQQGFADNFFSIIQSMSVFLWGVFL